MAYWGLKFVSYIDIKTTLAFLTLFLFLYYISRKRHNLPPGPIGLPLIGNLPGLAINMLRSGDDPEHLLAKLARHYGEVFSLKLGTNVVVVANGYHSIKEAFQNPLMNDRPKSKVMEETTLDEGLATTSGKSWRYQRTLTEGAFRNFGVGRSRFEGNVVAEANILVESIHKLDGKPFNPHVLLENCTANVICSVAFGKQYDHSDSEFQRLVISLNKIVKNMGSGGVFMFVPIMRYILPQTYKNMISTFFDFVNEVKTIVKEHERVFNKDNIQDVMDIFLNEIDIAGKRDDDYNLFIHTKALIGTSVFFFLAGTETTATTLRWALLYMMKYPDVQKKVQKEIDSVIGREQLPSWADRLSLPYTGAVLKEIQRIQTVLPLGIPHFTSADTTMCGNGIPQGSIIVPNIWAVHNDPDVWIKPDQFIPERFLNANGVEVSRDEFIPFSIGHRVCLGKNLAKMELFIFFTHLLHRFTIRTPNAEKTISIKGVSGLTYGPESFEIVADSRN